MFVKIANLIKNEEEKCWDVGETYLIECDEYIKDHFRNKDGFTELHIMIIKNKVVIHEMVYDDPTLHVEFYIENNEGKTVESFTFQNKLTDS